MSIFFPFSIIFFFILTVLIVVCIKIMMILGEAMALETHFGDSKHDQNVTVSMDIIKQAVFHLLSGVEPYLLFSIHVFVCSVIRSNSNTSNIDAGIKDQNSL